MNVDEVEEEEFKKVRSSSQQPTSCVMYIYILDHYICVQLAGGCASGKQSNGEAVPKAVPYYGIIYFGNVFAGVEVGLASSREMSRFEVQTGWPSIQVVMPNIERIFAYLRN